MRIQDIKTLTDKRGGLTVRLSDGTEPRKGYAVALGHKIAFAHWNMADLALGTWKDDGHVYMEISLIVEDKRIALSLAGVRGEKAIYDLAKRETIYL